MSPRSSRGKAARALGTLGANPGARDLAEPPAAA
jgi:hypothetical protein